LVEINISTSTLGRYLKEMDTQNVTTKIRNKGRVLTEEGKKRLKEKEIEYQSDILYNNIRNAINNSRYSELIDIYVVRKAIELESVRLCCKNITKDEIDILSNYTKQYLKLANQGDLNFINEALDFHTIISKASRNHFMDELLRMLIFEQKKLENRMEILVTRTQKTGVRYAQEHERILQCIQLHDEDKAVDEMRAHFDSMIDLLKENIKDSIENT